MFKLKYLISVFYLHRNRNDQWLSIFRRYLPSTTVTVQLLALSDRQAFTSGSSSSSSSSLWFLPVLNAGSHGSGSVGLSQVSIVVTADMVGLRFGCSCTHSSPIWMHLSTSAALDVSAMEWSMNSRLSPSFHSLHACTRKRKPSLLP
jgi:hypothetical protein